MPIVKRGDVGVTFADTLTTDAGPFDLTDCDVRFLLRRHGATSLTVDEPAEIVDATEGEVRYVTRAGDLDVAGVHLQEWEVATGDGEVLTFPSDGHNVVRIVPDLEAG